MEEKPRVTVDVKKFRLEKYDNDENGEPMYDKGPVEIIEGGQDLPTMRTLPNANY